VRIIVAVQDLPPGRTTSYTVASYVRDVLKLQALRRELGHTLLEVERCKKALKRRHQAGTLLTEVQRLLGELGIYGDGHWRATFYVTGHGALDCRRVGVAPTPWRGAAGGDVGEKGTGTP